MSVPVDSDVTAELVSQAPPVTPNEADGAGVISEEVSVHVEPEVTAELVSQIKHQPHPPQILVDQQTHSV